MNVHSQLVYELNIKSIELSGVDNLDRWLDSMFSISLTFSNILSIEK